MNMIKDYEHKEQADTVVSDTLNVSSFDKVSEIMDYEKDSPTIQKDIKEFENLSSTEKNTLETAVDSVGHGFDFLDEESNFDKVVDGAELPVDEAATEEAVEVIDEPIEEYFSSAEFILTLLDILIVWGLNIYLKRNDLDKISKEEFRRESIQQRVLVKKMAAVLKKHNQRISEEMQLALALFGTYGQTTKNIIERQKLRKATAIAESKNKPKNKKPTVVKMGEKPLKEKTAKKKEVFTLNVNEKIVEDKEEKISTGKSDLTDDKVRANMGIPPLDKVAKIGIK